MSEQVAKIDSIDASTTKFYSTRFAVAWLFIACLGLALLILRYKAMVGLAGAAVAIFAFQASISWVEGVVIRGGQINIPRTLVWWMPFLVLGRTKIPLSAIREITALDKFMGAERVLLAVPEGQVTVLFPSREKRLAFFDAFKMQKPDIKIYRSL